ncbi:uncharacterized protein LOC132946826 [Metopolophium dirhodum]|uniref:uncharacterized protein LOC132946826 n=1 Tax=Metopolophium dirhodum TaxID=44670 RepID=UPI00298FCC92|nr:uncharacterized protein LOC132946826 [Metopolophium dirhodum]
MESPSVILETNKRYFIEDKFLIVNCFYDQKKIRPWLKDWIGLYPCDNVKLYEPLIFEYVMDHPRIDGSCYKIKFVPQLFAKSIHCSGKYQFVYVDSYFKVIATSNPFQFVHKNDCNCNSSLSQSNCMVHIKIGQDINSVVQRLKCLEARLLEFEKGKQEAMELNEQLVKKLKACEMLRSRGEQFIDGLYKALDQGKPVKLTNSKGHTRWIKRMRTTEIRNHVISTKIVRNEVYLTAIINTQEQEIQRLRAINNELCNTNTYLKYYNQPGHIYEPQFTETIDAEDVQQFKSLSIESIPSAVVKFIDDSELSDDYCE